MTFTEKMNAGEDFVANLFANYGPHTEKGYPVELNLRVELSHKGKERGYRLSIMADLKVKECESLGLRYINTGGQCLDNAAEHLKTCGLQCKALDAIIPIWKEWHLNDMHAGSPAQEEYLKAYNKAHPGEIRGDYDKECELLKRKGLLVDKKCIVNGKPYKFGTGWLFREIPHKILLELCGILDGGMSIIKTGANDV